MKSVKLLNESLNNVGLIVSQNKQGFIKFYNLLSIHRSFTYSFHNKLNVSYPIRKYLQLYGILFTNQKRSRDCMFA